MYNSFSDGKTRLSHYCIVFTIKVLMVIKMVNVAVSTKEKNAHKRHTYQSQGYEIIAFCPGCKAMQIVVIVRGHLSQTRKFTQVADGIYHDCGSPSPCRLYGMM